jgi:hypothetical protein
MKLKGKVWYFIKVFHAVLHPIITYWIITLIFLCNLRNPVRFPPAIVGLSLSGWFYLSASSFFTMIYYISIFKGKRDKYFYSILYSLVAFFLLFLLICFDPFGMFSKLLDDD